jgi:tyrosinase
MVKKFTSQPIELPAPDRPFERADLIFYGVDHSGASYEGQVFLDPRGVGANADSTHRAYVGAFFIFGHGGCFGDLGHCDIPSERDPFDLRPAHQLEPALRVVTVTEAVRGLLERKAEAAKVTVLAHTAPRTPSDVLAFETVRLVSYA